MFGFSLAEVAVILTVALIALGPDKLPQVARSLAKVYGRLIRLKAEFAKAVEENVSPLDPAKWTDDLPEPGRPGSDVPAPGELTKAQSPTKDDPGLP
ncbi:MAG: twin-arginine translocase TatA/TatE family subunit [Deltaproteobacteria bacterium]|jgi:sec-independent protein translocase protein TatB|nr:twin-arginine translocase TatA/TatE family subunit [Deltaproteobacteria bacterium]